MTYGRRAAAVDRFFDWVRGRAPEQLRAIYEAAPAVRPPQLKAAHKLQLRIKPAAAEMQSIQKESSNVIRESGALEVFTGSGELADVAFLLHRAAYAIATRDRLPAESFDLIVKPFRDAGFDFDQEA
jgi:hypothetical protein